MKNQGIKHFLKINLQKRAENIRFKMYIEHDSKVIMLSICILFLHYTHKL